MSLLTIRNLSFAYSSELILENVNLKVQEKDFLAIIGPNGGGKSTLLKLILGINEISSGDIKILGDNPIKNLSSVGYVPQNTNVNIDFPIKVIEVVLMGHVEQSNDDKKKIWQKIFNIGYTKSEKECAMGVLEQVGMAKYANKKIGSLSGGQRQRVMIARALCSNPKILILDEPTASIDVNGQKQIYELLNLLNKDITIIVVSHDISVILSYATKVAHVNKQLVFHDISNQNKKSHSCDSNNEHFCEVEMLQMLGSCTC